MEFFLIKNPFFIYLRMTFSYYYYFRWLVPERVTPDTYKRHPLITT